MGLEGPYLVVDSPVNPSLSSKYPASPTKERGFYRLIYCFSKYNVILLLPYTITNPVRTIYYCTGSSARPSTHRRSMKTVFPVVHLHTHTRSVRASSYFICMTCCCNTKKMQYNFLKKKNCKVARIWPDAMVKHY